MRLLLDLFYKPVKCIKLGSEIQLIRRKLREKMKQNGKNRDKVEKNNSKNRKNKNKKMR